MDKRLQLMTAGAEDLEQWMLDAIRQGLAALDKRSDEWETIASRMVDAKSKGLSLRLQAIAKDREDGWPERMLEVFGQLYLSTQGLQNFEKLPPPLQQQLLQIAGVTISKKNLLEEEGITDDWLILSRWRGLNQDRAATQKTWLLGMEEQQIAMLMEYDYMGDGFKNNFQIGQTIHGTIVYFPESYPIRAILKKWSTSEKSILTIVPFQDTTSFLREFGRALAANPWLRRFPFLMENATPIYENEQFSLLDQDEKIIPMTVKALAGWTMVSMSGSKPVTVFGEWDGASLHPLAVFMGERFIDLGAMVSDISGAKRFGGFGR